MNEIERKLSIISDKSRRTRKVIVTIAIVSLLVTTAMLVGASLIGFYYQQNVTIDVEALVTITDVSDPQNPHDAGWEQTFTVGTGTFYPGDTETIGSYKITVSQNDITTVRFYFHILEITERNEGDPPENAVACTDDGLIITIYTSTETILTTSNGVGHGQLDINSGNSNTFTIDITADPLLDSFKTYGYTLTINNIPAPP